MQRLFKILLFVFLFFLLILGFALPLNPPNGFWYQQFMPNLNGRSIIDIEFTDSLTGYAITSSDTPYVLKTTNGGNNWSINLIDTESFTAFAFINSNTGFITRGTVNGYDMLYKTTNGGANWFTLNMPENGIAMDISVLNEDTFWVADPTPLNIGGLYRTIDGGASWLRTFAGGNNNPEHIYMFNFRIGFMTLSQGGSLWKTTDGGFNWAAVSGGVWTDIFFIDSLTGWKANGNMKKTTDGGLNWVTQVLPSGGIIFSNGMASFSVLNKDTIWGSGGLVFYGGGITRGILYRTTNGGDTWKFQIPDTSFRIGIFSWIQFLNKNIGWAYHRLGAGIHTTNGGDTTFLLGVTQISSEIPKEFKLYQNYPNPFNPITNIKYQISNSKYQSKTMVKLIIYDLIGKEIIVLVNGEQKAGIYQVDFSGDGYSSGVYFYTLIVDDIRFDTKKMLLIK